MFIENKVLSGNDEQRLWLSFWTKYYIQLYDER